MPRSCGTPTARAEPQHGVTSVVMGNCGLTLAPAQARRPRDASSRASCAWRPSRASPWKSACPGAGRPIGDYLDALEGRVGLNVGGLVGHIALRQYVMGEESVEREATRRRDRRACRRSCARRWRAARWACPRTATSATCARTASRSPAAWPTPRSSTPCADVLGELNAGVIETIVGLQHASSSIAWYDQLARRSGRPVIWQSVLHRWAAAELSGASSSTALRRPSATATAPTA